MTNLPSTHPGQRRGSGFSLVELLVALAVSLFLLGGVLQIYLGSKQTYNAVEQVSRMQENARYALHVIAEAARDAGYTGCSTGLGPLTNTLKQATDLAYNFSLGVDGFEASGSGPGATISYTTENPTAGGTWDKTLPTDIAAVAIPGSDILVLRGPAGGNIPIARNNSSSQLFAHHTGTDANTCPGGVDKIDGICPGDILLVSNCRFSRVFQATGLTESSASPCSSTEKCANITHAASGTPGNDITSWGGASAPAQERFGPDSEILRLQTQIFFVGVGADGGPSFYQQVNGGPLQELVSGVENMQVLYGEDSDADGVANQYRPFNSVGDPTQVVSLRVGLLLRTDAPVGPATNTRTYQLNGVTSASATTIDPFDDRRGRTVFNTTLKLRNR